MKRCDEMKDQDVRWKDDPSEECFPDPGSDLAKNKQQHDDRDRGQVISLFRSAV